VGDPTAWDGLDSLLSKISVPWQALAESIVNCGRCREAYLEPDGCPEAGQFAVSMHPVVGGAVRSANYCGRRSSPEAVVLVDRLAGSELTGSGCSGV